MVHVMEMQFSRVYTIEGSPEDVGHLGRDAIELAHRGFATPTREQSTTARHDRLAVRIDVLGKHGAGNARQWHLTVVAAFRTFGIDGSLAQVDLGKLERIAFAHAHRGLECEEEEEGEVIAAEPFDDRFLFTRRHTPVALDILPGLLARRGQHFRVLLGVGREAALEQA